MISGQGVQEKRGAGSIRMAVHLLEHCCLGAARL